LEAVRSPARAISPDEAVVVRVRTAHHRPVVKPIGDSGAT
jgi:hypothetical protein